MELNISVNGYKEKVKEARTTILWSRITLIRVFSAKKKKKQTWSTDLELVKDIGESKFWHLMRNSASKKNLPSTY